MVGRSKVMQRFRAAALATNPQAGIVVPSTPQSEVPSASKTDHDVSDLVNMPRGTEDEVQEVPEEAVVFSEKKRKGKNKSGKTDEGNKGSVNPKKHISGHSSHKQLALVILGGHESGSSKQSTQSQC
ncbi:putative TonB-dependent receptor [Sesbania bispinosa]|nr:putative TonB-dependent receptor [Sesbania bispinosa]